MSTNISIVDRVVERLKAQPIGDLIAEEDLYDILKEAIPRVFFEKQVITTGTGYNQTTTTKDPVLVEVMRELLEEEAKRIAKEQLTIHADKIMAMWKQVLEEGLVEFAQKVQREQMTRHIGAALASLVNQINQDRAKMGLPYLNW